MDKKTVIAAILLVSGCMCGYSTPPPQPQIIMYAPTSTEDATSTTQATTTTTTTTLQETATAAATTTTLQPKTTVDRYIPGEYQAKKTAPLYEIPEGFNRCRNDTDCMIVTDCCREYGRQYAINHRYQALWYDRLKCWNQTLPCYTNLHLSLQRYRYVICDSGTCQKTYNNPEKEDLTDEILLRRLQNLNLSQYSK